MMDKINAKFVEKNLPPEVKGILEKISKDVMELTAKVAETTKLAVLDQGLINDNGDLVINKNILKQLGYEEPED